MGAFDKDQIVGICGLVSIKIKTYAGLRNVGSLIQLYVKPDYRRIGIGFHLVEYLKEEGFQIPGIEHIVLEVKEINQPAYRIFKQAGFIPYEPDTPPGRQSTQGSLIMIHNRSSHNAGK